MYSDFSIDSPPAKQRRYNDEKNSGAIWERRTVSSSSTMPPSRPPSGINHLARDIFQSSSSMQLPSSPSFFNSPEREYSPDFSPKTPPNSSLREPGITRVARDIFQSSSSMPLSSDPYFFNSPEREVSLDFSPKTPPNSIFGYARKKLYHEKKDQFWEAAANPDSSSLSEPGSSIFSKDKEEEFHFFHRPPHHYNQQTFIPMFRPFLNENGVPKKPSKYLNSSALLRKPLFLQNAVAVQNNGYFLWNENRIQFDFQHQLMNGQFNVFARISNGQDPLIPGKNNSEIAMKTFRDHCIMVASGSDKLNNSAAVNVAEQYAELSNANIPVAEIYNIPEVLKHCGFFLVEFVPNSFQIWEPGTKITSMSEIELDLLDQLKKIIQTTYYANIIPDLKPDNLRVREDGTLTIIDLRENKADADEKNFIFKKMIHTFNCREGDEIYNHLNPI